jgi:hypothetical protein
MLQPELNPIYLDPTVGSIVFQTAIGGLLAIGAAVRLYWNHLQRLFRRLPRTTGGGDHNAR